MNNDPVHNGAEQFFQWLAVDPTDGSVDVLFYDRRGDPTGKKQIVVLARSTDGARSFANHAWTDEPFEASGVFFGDYTGLADMVAGERKVRMESWRHLVGAVLGCR